MPRGRRGRNRTAAVVAGTAAAVAVAVGVASRKPEPRPPAPVGSSLQQQIDATPAGGVLSLQGQVYRLTARLQPRRSITIHGNGAVLDGGGTIDQGIRLQNVSDVSIDGLTVQNCKAFGFFIQYASRIQLSGVKAFRNGTTGILVPTSTHVTLEDAETAHNRGEHGVYFSRSSDHVTIRRLRSYSNGRTGLQINADIPGSRPGGVEGDGLSFGIVVEDCDFYDNGSTGLNLAGVRGGVFRNLRIRSRQNGVALWDDGAPYDANCRDVIFQRCRIEAVGQGVRIVKGSTGTKLEGCTVSGSPRIYAEESLVVDGRPLPPGRH